MSITVSWDPQLTEYGLGPKWAAMVEGLPVEVWMPSPETERVPYGARWYVLLRGVFSHPHCPRLEGRVFIPGLIDRVKEAQAVKTAQERAAEVARLWQCEPNTDLLWARFVALDVNLIGEFCERKGARK